MTHQHSSDKASIKHLIADFRRSRNSDDCVFLASKLYQRFLLGDSIPATELRSVLTANVDERKRACTLQLLAQIGDNQALPYFLDELRRGAEEVATHSSPSVSLITAVTYIRLLKIPQEEVYPLLSRIQNCANNYLSIQGLARKQLVAGALISAGVLERFELLIRDSVRRRFRS